jgi:hypothetical protein
MEFSALKRLHLAGLLFVYLITLFAACFLYFLLPYHRQVHLYVKFIGHFLIDGISVMLDIIGLLIIEQN